MIALVAVVLALVMHSGREIHLVLFHSLPECVTRAINPSTTATHAITHTDSIGGGSEIWDNFHS